MAGHLICPAIFLFSSRQIYFTPDKSILLPTYLFYLYQLILACTQTDLLGMLQA